MEEIKKIMLNAKPKWTEKSLNSYSSNFSKIHFKLGNQLEDEPDFNYIEDYEKVIDFINNLAPYGKPMKDSTKKNYYQSCMAMVEGMNGGRFTDKWEKLPEWIAYKDKVVECNNDYKEKQASGSLVGSQADNVVSVLEIDNMMKDIYNSKIKNLKTKKTIEPNEIELLQFYLLMTLYKQYPVRNELSSLILIGKREFNKLKKEKNDTENYIYVLGNKTFMIRNKYKTSTSSQSGGEKIDEITGQAKTILNLWIRLVKPQDKLFPLLNPHTNPNSNNLLTLHLQKHTEKYLDKKISTTLLFKILFGDVIENGTIKKLNNIAKVRGSNPSNVINTYLNKEFNPTK